MRKILTLLIVLMLGVIIVNAQTTRTITGKVSDTTGNPVSGASILIKGTTRGVAAAPDGTFSIGVKKGDELVVSALNYASTSITIDEQTNLSVTLTGSTSVINEVVVTALGLTRNRNQVPYAA